MPGPVASLWSRLQRLREAADALEANASYDRLRAVDCARLRTEMVLTKRALNRLEAALSAAPAPAEETDRP